jgi:two-component system response regulator CpxR
MIRKMSHPHSDRGHRLLVIDDDRKLCSLIADYLDPLGYDVTPSTPAPKGAQRAVPSRGTR